MENTLSAVPCDFEAVFTLTTFTSQTSLRTDNVLNINTRGNWKLTYHINRQIWSQEKGPTAERQETRTSRMIPYSHGDGLSVMSHTNKTLHLTPKEGGKNTGIK